MLAGIRWYFRIKVVRDVLFLDDYGNLFHYEEELV